MHAKENGPLLVALYITITFTYGQLFSSGSQQLMRVTEFEFGGISHEIVGFIALQDSIGL